MKHHLFFSLVAIAASVSPALAQISKPIIPGISVEIADVVQLPDTRGPGLEDSRVASNHARINFMHEIPGSSDEWMVPDLRGQVYRVNPSTQEVVEYLNVSDLFPRFNKGPSGLSSGLNTVAFHPEFSANGKFYSIHSESWHRNPATPDFGDLSAEIGHTVVVEWTAADPTASTFSGSHREILSASQVSRIHNLGDITFNPFATEGDADYGLMYISGGDSNAGAPAQDLNSIYGKLLRIDPGGNNSANGAYGIPADNPFASDGDPNTLGEIYAYGFRNLHRISWDLETGVLLGTDIGENSVEEVNFLEAGGNYGWSNYEGTFTRGGGPVSPVVDKSQYVWPAAQYDHGDGDAIAGGFVYRGTQIPELFGKFVYGDIVNGRMFYSDLAELTQAHEDGNYLTTADVYELFLTKDGEPVTLKDLVRDARSDHALPNDRVDLRLAQTSDGELYLSTKQDGWIRQLVGDAVPGDYNANGIVDLADYTVWRDSLGASGGSLVADGNGDESVDLTDYEIWKTNFGLGRAAASGATSAVPEPASWLLLAATMATALYRRRQCPN